MPQEENGQAVHSSTGLWHHGVALTPTRGQTPTNLEANPFWAPIEEGGGCAKHFQGAPWRD